MNLFIPIYAHQNDGFDQICQVLCQFKLSIVIKFNPK
jgi:hypothetical protein